jgi:4-amino-4-deoxy-L-arabinose transferase-like glycosyltransferase
MPRRALTGICFIAFVHAAIFIGYQRPDWTVAWTDQGGYKQLGAVLARTGLFTRYPDYAVFVPEVIRTPGYPAFVALVYAVFGQGNDMAVAIAQGVVFALICLVVYAIARRVTSQRTALIAAAVTSLYPPLPYFGALVLTEVWATLVITIAMLFCVRAAHQQRPGLYAIAGVLFSAGSLIRPGFVLLPFFLAIGLPLLVRTHRNRRGVINWGVLAVTAALTLLPWFTYNYVYLGRFTLSPAGGVGRGLWEGSWQGRWPGRVHASLTDVAEEPTSTEELDKRIDEIAARAQLDPAPMKTYTHEWRDIRAIWERPTDPIERTTARVVADQQYLAAALAHIGEDPAGHVVRRLTRGLFVLWASEIPIRFTDINRTPVTVIRLIWGAQVLLLIAAAGGLIFLAANGQWLDAVLLALPLIYVTGVHVPLLCEARQSLPVKPLVIIAAAIGVSALWQRLFPFKPQMHERQHL